MIGNTRNVGIPLIPMMSLICKTPKFVHFLKEFPLTASGKVIKEIHHAR